MSELIVSLRAQGVSNKEIAERLGIHTNTVILRAKPDSRERQREYNRNFRAKHRKAMQYPPNVVRIGPEQAVVLSYLQGLAPVGQWFMPVTAHITSDLLMTPSNISNHARKLAAKGLIERRKVGKRWYEYRVLRRLEDKDVFEVRPARKSYELMRDMAKERALARAKPKIRYAGYMVGDLSRW